MKDSRFVWLASYPRSGNTWVRFLLESLIFGGDAVDINRPRIHFAVVNPGEFDAHFAMDPSLLTQDEIEAARPELWRKLLDDASGRLVFRKAHEQWSPFFPAGLSRGAVCIVRDPRDVAISLSRFRAIGIDEGISLLADENFWLNRNRTRVQNQFPQFLGSWSGNVRSWVNQSEIPVFPVRYEDLVDSTELLLREIALFLGLPPENAARAADAHRFEALRAAEQAAGFREVPPKAGSFFRQGCPGAWKRILTAAQAQKIEADHGETMKRFGYI
jgi:aryl sulfotransferase